MANSLEGYSTALRMIDFFKIPRENGDCVVLVLVHPGLNLLGRYLPPSKVNVLLLADISRVRPPGHGDFTMSSTGDLGLIEEMEAFDIMDLASFLEYACPKHEILYADHTFRFSIQATHCLEILHKSIHYLDSKLIKAIANISNRAGVVHREGC
jgi:hypothetical protein